MQSITKFLRTRHFRLSLTGAYFILTVFLFFLPGSSFPVVTWMDVLFLDKWVHLGIFAILTLLCLWAFDPPLKILLLVLLAVYGLIVELVQHFLVANRSFDVYDLLADIAGIIFGYWLGRYLKK